MCVKVESPRLAERGQRAVHHEPPASVELGTESLGRRDLMIAASKRCIRRVFTADFCCFNHLSPRGRLYGAGEAAHGLGCNGSSDSEYGALVLACGEPVAWLAMSDDVRH